MFDWTSVDYKTPNVEPKGTSFQVKLNPQKCTPLEANIRIIYILNWLGYKLSLMTSDMIPYDSHMLSTKLPTVQHDVNL